MLSNLDDILVVIPARGGSKRIKKKNIKSIGGQPMIFWPLQELSKIFRADQILVSTDDEEIVQSVSEAGLQVPFRRPQHLANDHAATMPVVSHALHWYEEHRKKVDLVLIVYPTAVMLNHRDIIDSIETIKSDSNCDCIFPATEFSYPIQRSIYTRPDGYVEMFHPENFQKRSQDLVQGLHDAGQFYLCRPASIRDDYNVFSSRSRVIRLPRHRVIDIDTEEDFLFAEMLLNHNKYRPDKINWRPSL
ncbi:pseudaminic acid cytidylyltransferase [Rhizobium sp. Nf11,1]|uniref:pseudaminic acid cytidylyltransferase n=1 Tax=Rhizobium sp. Nf11,1 TaxID=3404923 RepID=UPI003D341DFF